MVKTKRFFINWHLNHVLWHAKQSDSDIHQITERTKEKKPWTCNGRHVNRVVLCLETRDFPHCGGGGGAAPPRGAAPYPFFQYIPFFPLSRTWTTVLQDETAVHGCDCRGVMVVQYVRYCHIAELIRVPQCWNCYSVQGVPSGFSPAMGRPPCDKSGEARQTDCKLHLSINCKRPKV